MPIIKQVKHLILISIQGPEENMEYYHEYMRLYIANVVLTNQVKYYHRIFIA
jgi:hypothetical protein